MVIVVSYWREKRKITEVGQPCRRCETPVVFKESKFKKKKLAKNYYFTGYYFCPNCRTNYYSNKFKVVNSKETIKKNKSEERPEERPFAIYKIVKGKRFLKNNDHDFVEVELRQLKNGAMKVCPVSKKLSLF